MSEPEIPKEIRDFEISCRFFYYKDWESVFDHKNKVRQFIGLLETSLKDCEGHLYKRHIIQEFQDVYDSMVEEYHKDAKKRQQGIVKMLDKSKNSLELNLRLLRGAITSKQVVFSSAEKEK